MGWFCNVGFIGKIYCYYFLFLLNVVIVFGFRFVLGFVVFFLGIFGVYIFVIFGGFILWD